MRFALLICCLFCGVLHAQGVGDPAPNKAFLATWNMPGGEDELADFQPSRVVLLDWFGAS